MSAPVSNILASLFARRRKIADYTSLLDTDYDAERLNGRGTERMKSIFRALLLVFVWGIGVQAMAQERTTLGAVAFSTVSNRSSEPSAPENLRATVYSSTAIGLVWQRSTTARLRHEIRRDGVVVGMTDGTTFVDLSLRAGRRFVFDVIAIAEAGERSPAARLIVRTDGEPVSPAADPVGTLVPYTLPSGPAILQAKLSGPLPSSYAVRCDSLQGDTCAVEAGRYQLQTFDRRWIVTASIITIREGDGEGEGEGEPPPPPPANTLPATTLPTIDADGEVVWPFAPVAGGLTIELSEYTRLPLARSGRQPRMNDMFHANGRLFVLVEEDGLVYDVSDASAPVVWFDVGAAIEAATGRELDTRSRFHGGLRSAAFHPDFPANGKLYTALMEERPASRQGHVYLSDIEDAIEADSVVVEWTVDPRSMIVDRASYREVFRVGVPEYDHPIKQIEFNPRARRGDADRGLLYIGHGDGSFASETARGGRRDDALGKVLRIDPLATADRPFRVPMDNPFVGDETMIDEAFSIGHRNPHHLSFGEDGSLLVADVGRDNIDEINLVMPGRDYGWAEREGAYVQLPSGGIFEGIAPLPNDDARNDFTYPVAGFGHAGRPGGSFVARAIVGGPVMRSATGGEPFYLYTEFARTGEILYSHIDDINASVTQGSPDELSYARTRRASIRFDTDGDPATPGLPQASLQQLVASDPGYDGSGRVDNRFGTDSAGNLFVMNKRNGVIYRARITGVP